jgi:DNA-binding HxlR family transcriptional regulator
MAKYKPTVAANERVRHAMIRLFEINRDRPWTLVQINASLRALDLPLLNTHTLRRRLDDLIEMEHVDKIRLPATIARYKYGYRLTWLGYAHQKDVPA